MEDQTKVNGLDELEVIDTLNACVRTLQQGIDSHCCLVNAMVEKKAGAGYREQLARQCPKRSREALLRGALKDTVSQHR
jgi:hypothetical protein